jgi:hypothetical protein
MMKNMMTKFSNGHADVKGVYFDEENRRHLYTIRQSFADLAKELLAKGRKEDAKNVVLKADALVPDTNVPYAMPSRYEFHNQASWTLMEAAYEAGASDLAGKINKQLNTDFGQHMEYIASLGDMTRKQLEDILMNYNQRRYMEQMQQQQGGQADAYLTSNLAPNQIGLAFEMNRVFNLMQYVKGSEERYNPKTVSNDTLNKKPDSGLVKPNTDTSKPK